LMMWGIRLDPRGEATGNRRTTSRVPWNCCIRHIMASRLRMGVRAS
jgi:hypothetical protein